MLYSNKKKMVHVLHIESKKIFFKLGHNFIKKEELRTDCNIKSPHITLQIEDIYVMNI